MVSLKLFYTFFFQELTEVMKILQTEFRKELEQQGHKLTGKLIDSIDFEIKNLSEAIVAEFYFENYGVYMDLGVAANRIPYSPGSGAKTSKYIAALIDFFKKRGILSDKEAKSAAFATARIHKREGLPTRGSFAFSNNGRRTGFVNRVITDQSDKIFNLVDYAAANSMEVTFNQMLEKISIKLAA